MQGTAGLHELLARQSELLQQALLVHQSMVQRLREQEEAVGQQLQVPPQPAHVPLQMPGDHLPLMAGFDPAPSEIDSPEAVPAGEAKPPGESARALFRSGSMFPSPEDIRARVALALHKAEYNVEDFYSRTGFWQALACNAWFKRISLVAIALNTLWIAVETDYNKADVLCNAPVLFQVVDNLFCAFFAFEICTRFLAFDQKKDAFTDGWFVFDATLVALMVWETWVAVVLYLIVGGTDTSSHTARRGSILRILRMFRLTRVARMARLMRNMPELMILIKGMMMGVRAVSATLLLLFVIIYVFAVMFTQLLAGSEAGADCFDNVPMAINCLLVEGVFTEQAEFIRKLLEEDWMYYVLGVVYLLLASLTVMNMLIAVLCEVVAVVAQVENQEILMKDIRSRIATMVHHLGRGTRVVRKDDLHALAGSPEALRGLHEIGVDVVALVDLADFIFRDQQELDVEAFMEVVLQFRGSNTATVKDVVDMRKFMCRELSGLETRLMTTNKRLRV